LVDRPEVYPGDPAVAKPLTYDQQSAINRAAGALHSADQVVFRSRVLAQLQSAPELEDGVIYRTCAQVQRQLFKPPADDLAHHAPRQLKRFG
jgi:hypothetical protein